MKALALLLLTLLSAPPSHGADQRSYQERATDYPDTYKEYPLIHLDLKTGDTKVSFLWFKQETGGYNPYRFDPVTVPAGKELEIRGYWLSKNLIEAYRLQGGKKKAGPQYDEILKAFRSSDSKAMMEMLGRLSEINDNDRPKPPYGTGMIEVEDPNAKGKDEGKRRFIPLEMLRNGSVEVSANSARLKILKSLVLSVADESLGFVQETSEKVIQDKAKMQASVARVVAGIECNTLSQCATNGSAFTQAVEAIFKVGLVDNSKNLDIMDPNYEKKLNRTEFSKLTRIFQDLQKQCQF